MLGYRNKTAVRNRRLPRLFYVMLFSIIFFAHQIFASDVPRFFRLATGLANGSYFNVGAVIANIISVPEGSRPCAQGGPCGVPGLLAVAQTTQGSLENLYLLKDGQVEAALIQADIASAAFTGTKPFTGKPFPELRLLTALYPETLHLVVRADSTITNIKALSGRRIGIGERLSGTTVAAEHLLAILGVRNYTPDTRRTDLALQALLKKSLDAVIIMGGDPIPMLVATTEKNKLRLLTLSRREQDRLLQDFPEAMPVSITSDMYNGITASDGIAIPVLLAVRADLDSATVKAIATALHRGESLVALAQVHPLAGSLIGKDQAYSSIPLHSALKE